MKEQKIGTQRAARVRPVMASGFYVVSRAGVTLQLLCDSLDKRPAIVNDDGAYYCGRCWEYRDQIAWDRDN